LTAAALLWRRARASIWHTDEGVTPICRAIWLLFSPASESATMRAPRGSVQHVQRRGGRGLAFVPVREHFGVSFGKDSGARDSTGGE